MDETSPMATRAGALPTTPEQLLARLTELAIVGGGKGCDAAGAYPEKPVEIGGAAE